MGSMLRRVVLSVVAVTAVVAVSATVTAAGVSALPLKATLTVPTLEPQANVRWPYTVHVTDATGKPLGAKITVRTVDPLGGKHPVQLERKKTDIVAFPIKGTFTDAVVWPAEAQGVPLTFQVVVTALGKTTTLAKKITVTAAAGPGPAATSFKATLTVATLTPKVNATWPYTVRVTDAKGKPLAATITVRIVDPLGGKHPVEFFDKKKDIVAFPIAGTFRDAVAWPASARGYPLKFQVLATAGGKTVILSKTVTVK